MSTLPYKVEYAKSNRSCCRKCKGSILKDDVRLGVLLQSDTFDGKIVHWYHEKCFFMRQRPNSIYDVDQFDLLRWEDQGRIREKIELGGKMLPKGAKEDNVTLVNKDFSIQYAKTTRAPCGGCNIKIKKGEIRISKLDFHSEKAKRFAPKLQWYHVKCFVELRLELGFLDCGSTITGFQKLKEYDRIIIKEMIKSVERKGQLDEVEAPGSVHKKMKISLNDGLEEQNKMLFNFRDLLEKNLDNNELKLLVEHNEYTPPTGKSEILYLLADLMTFGVIGKCRVCGNGRLHFKSGVGYVCDGNVSGWTACTNTIDSPRRSPFRIPDKLKTKYEFLCNYKFKRHGNRIIVKKETCEEENTCLREEIGERKPLKGLTFVVVGRGAQSPAPALAEKVKSLGGLVSSVVFPSTAAVVTTPEMIERSCDDLISSAKQLGVGCVSECFMEGVTQENIFDQLKKKKISPWGDDVEKRLLWKNDLKASYKSKLQNSDLKFSFNRKSFMEERKICENYISNQLLSGYHVFESDEKMYSFVLTRVDLAKNTNSYYVLQLLKPHAVTNVHHYIYRKWGRVGTSIDGESLELMEDERSGLSAFKSIYEQKTGNDFLSRDHKKIPGLWFPADIETVKSFKVFDKELIVSNSKSDLPLAIKELIVLLYDVKIMEKTIVNLKIDAKKMPLGRMSSSQMAKALAVLTEALKFIDTNVGNGESKSPDFQNRLLDYSNRFYNLIPHSVGIEKQPLLGNKNLIQDKMDLVEDLREIELNYRRLIELKIAAIALYDPFDTFYKQFQTELTILDKSSKEFDIINQYWNNTVIENDHRQRQIIQAFKVERDGEADRFKKCQHLHNRKLLWHGSRLTNFVSILSKGLRLPSSRRGIFFADAASKSLAFSQGSTNKACLMLLCEVALGDSYEVKDGNGVRKLPDGKHSTKALGRFEPDPSGSIWIDDRVEVPLGTMKETSIVAPVFSYNEFIIYDEAQINIKFCLCVQSTTLLTEMDDQENYSLREMLNEELDDVIEKARRHLPHSLTVYNLLSVGFKRNIVDRQVAKVYLPRNSKLPFFIIITGTVIKRNRQNLMPFWDPNELSNFEAKRLLKALPDWNWEAVTQFYTASLLTLNEIEKIMLSEDGLCQNKLKLTRHDGFTYKLEDNNLIENFNISDEFVLAPLGEEDAPLVHKHWIYNYNDTVEGIRGYMKALPSIAAFVMQTENDETSPHARTFPVNRNGSLELVAHKPVAWALSRHFGEIGCTFTLPEYRNKGLSSAIVCELSKRLLKIDVSPYVIICGNNPAAVKSHEKIGFRKYCPIAHHIYLPDGMKWEDY